MNDNSEKRPGIPEWIKDQLEGKNQPPEPEDKKDDDDSFERSMGMEITNDEIEDQKPAAEEKKDSVENRYGDLSDVVMRDMLRTQAEKEKKEQNQDKDGIGWGD